MIDSPFMEEMKQYMEKKYREEGLREGRAEGRAEGLRESISVALETRFGSVPPDRLAGLAAVTDVGRLQALHRLAMTCPDLDTFVAELAAGQ